MPPLPPKPPIRRRWTPRHWASWSPFGIGHQRPNNYKELWRAWQENRGERAFAWRILTQGVCDGCALGTTGIHDWTLDGVHLCNIRLRLLRLNTMPAVDLKWLEDVSTLGTFTSEQLRNLGRLPYPLLRRKGEPGFTRISWNEALDLVAQKIGANAPDRSAFYLTSRGMPNEAYYTAQKAVRAMGTNNIDNAARICHSPSTVALKAAVGVAASTCSYSDWMESDLIVFVGSNIANNQPVATKYLHFAKKQGAKIVCVNTYREPGMERYWIPSLPESALFGTHLTDQFFLIHTGGDVGFFNGVMKHLVEQGWLDETFIAENTEGFSPLQEAVKAMSWEPLEELAGVSRAVMFEFAQLLQQAKKAVFVWSMGVTQHVCGVDNVRSLLNVALSQGYVGRPGCGLMPIRGHSGVQGGAEMGAYATAFPGGAPITEETAAHFSKLWNFPVPSTPGMNAPQMLDAAHGGQLEMLFSVGGNFLEVMPDPPYVEECLNRVPLRVHMDLVLTHQMFLEAGEAVLLLPAATRYETPGGVTQTSTERRVIFSPEVPGRRVGEARPEWSVFLDLAKRVKPEHAATLQLETTAAVREEIARAVPMYEGIQHLRQAGDQFQYGGAHLCADGRFQTADGKAHFASVALPINEVPEGHFKLATRRGKQFNSMVHEKKDSITGAHREAIFINGLDAEHLGLQEGDEVQLVNETGQFRGKIFVSTIMRGNLQVHWPEGNTLLDKSRRSAAAGVPDYNALVRLEPVPKD